MIETHRSFANMWECDENNHMNVQFFFKRFEEAHLVFTRLNGDDKLISGLVSSRHVRFHSEIRAGESLQIFSGKISAGIYKNCIVHRMVNAVTGKLHTTALDQCVETFEADCDVEEHYLAEAVPRGILGSGPEIFDTKALLAAGQAMEANFNVIRKHDLDEGGNFLTSRIVSMFTDGAPHVWEKAGITTDWLNANGFGRVAVEMRLAPISKPREGEPLRLVSRVGELAGRTFRLDHQIETIKGKTVIATGSARGLVMDLASRKAVQLPGGFSADFSS